VSRYVPSSAAVADLELTWDYTYEHWGDAQTEEYAREIQRAIERVVDNPMIERLRRGPRRIPQTRPRMAHAHYRIADIIVSSLRARLAPMQ
jgi:toxin ParE1/3/4